MKSSHSRCPHSPVRQVGLTSAQFSLGGDRIVIASDRSVQVRHAGTGKVIATLHGDIDDEERGGILLSSDFHLSSDGTSIVSARLFPHFRGDGSDEKKSLRKALVWTVLQPSAGPPPEWFPDFLRYMAKMRLNRDGELETLDTAKWLKLRERLRIVLRASASADTPYLRILRKYVPL